MTLGLALLRALKKHGAPEIFGIPGDFILPAGRMLMISASVGIDVYPEDGESGATLITKADAALYRAKKAATAAFCFVSRCGLTPKLSPS